MSLYRSLFYCYVSLIPSPPTLSLSIPVHLHKFPDHNALYVFLSVALTSVHDSVWLFCSAKEEKSFLLGKLWGFSIRFYNERTLARGRQKWETLDVTTVKVNPLCWRKWNRRRRNWINWKKRFLLPRVLVFFWHGASIREMMIKLFSWLTAPAAQAQLC